MATFVYQVMTPESRVRWGAGRYPFQDEVSMTSYLERSGNVVLFAAAVPRFVEQLLAGYYRASSRRIKAADLAEFLRSMAIMVRSGIPFLDALTEAVDAAENRRLRKVGRGLEMAVESGLGVHAAFSRYADVFPPHVLHMIRVGERAGRLDEALLTAAEHVGRAARIRVDVRKALIYPLIAFTIAVFACVFWLHFTVPALIELYQEMGITLPAVTQMLLDLSDAARNNAGTIGIALVVVLLGFRVFYLCNGRCRFWSQRIALRLPVIGRIGRNAALAYFSEYFATLLQAGVNTYQSLGIVASSLDNEPYRRAVLDVQAGVERGGTLSAEIARHGLFPGVVCRMVKTGEQTGTLAEQLSLLSREYGSRLKDVIDVVKSLVEPLAILVVGVLMVLIIVALFFPIYELVVQTSEMV